LTREMARSNPELAPPAGRFLTAEWRLLTMLNYQVDPGLLFKFIPTGTELDSWQGKTFVSLVGFRFLRTRVWGIAVPFHCNFEEVNLRFYVRRRVGSEMRRGVVFIREIVPRRLIATIARLVYNERYVNLPMSHEIHQHDSRLSVEYSWKFRGRRNRIKVVTDGDAASSDDGSEAQFITEHYWGYAAQADGGCVEYQVEHPPWKVWTVSKAVFEGEMEDLYGMDLNAELRRPPVSAFLAEGSPVCVYRGTRL
jgi:uncharacterized protein